ncbi:MAG: YceI family protein [Bdellovibrionales bacterium]|nr:YceI family protein [Bdellovibrionales bacterium]
MKLVIFFLQIFTLFIAPLFAEPVVRTEVTDFNLAQNDSRVDFIFSSPIIQTGGRFQEYTGKLTFDPNLNKILKINISLNVSKFTLSDQSISTTVALTSLANTLDNPNFQFESTDISKVGTDKLKVAGYLIGSGKRKAAVFYAIQKNSQPGRLNFIAQVESKDFDINWPKEIAVFGEQYISAKINFNLLFLANSN